MHQKLIVKIAHVRSQTLRPFRNILRNASMLHRPPEKLVDFFIRIYDLASTYRLDTSTQLRYRRFNSEFLRRRNDCTESLIRRPYFTDSLIRLNVSMEQLA